MRRHFHLVSLLFLGLACSAFGGETVTNGHELLSVKKKLLNGVPFKVTGQVVIPPFWTNLPFCVDLNGQVAEFFWRLETSGRHCAIGDIVQISGVTGPSRNVGTTNLDCTDLKVISHGTLPDIPVVSVADYLLEITEKAGIKNPTTVSNLSSSRALRDVTEKHGGTYYAAAVGEVNVTTKMREVNALIGGEGNGGVI